MAGRRVVQRWFDTAFIVAPKRCRFVRAGPSPVELLQQEPQTFAEEVLSRIRRADRGQFESLHLQLVVATKRRRCQWRDCPQSTRKTPFCKEHLAKLKLRIGPSTVCDGEGLFAEALPEELEAAAAKGLLPTEVEVFGPNTQYFVCLYDGILVTNPLQHWFDQLDATGEWTFCFKIDSLTYIDAALLNFLGRFINCAYPDAKRGNVRFVVNTRRKEVLVRATKPVFHRQELIAKTYGGGYFPRLMEKLETGKLCRCDSRGEVRMSNRTARAKLREGSLSTEEDAPEREGGDAVLEPFPLSPLGRWWENPPKLRPPPKRNAPFGARPKNKKKKKNAKASGGGLGAQQLQPQLFAADPESFAAAAGDLVPPPSGGPALFLSGAGAEVAAFSFPEEISVDYEIEGHFGC
eukprot:tig00021583_g22648.t1